jgi:tetratricopeptide (TPR) repeat protein
MALGGSAGWADEPPEIAAALKAYDAGQFQQAAGLFQAATQTLSSPAEQARAWLYLGFSQARLQDVPASRRSFAKALAVDPEVKVDSGRAPPDAIQEIEAFRQMMVGSLQIEAGEPDARVLVDGQERGRGSVTLTLPIGRHGVKVLSADSHREFEEPRVIVMVDQVVRLKAALAPGPRAQQALATALALLKDQRFAPALQAVGEALRAWAEWPETLRLRGRIHEGLAGPDSTLEALRKPERGRDYSAVASRLRAAADDLERYARLKPDAPDRPEVAVAIERLRERALTADRAQQAARALEAEERERLAREAEGQRRAQERAMREAAERARHETKRASKRRWRWWGYGLLGGAVALGATTGVFAYLGARQNTRIQEGGFTTGGEIADAASKGKAYNGAAWGLGATAAALAGTGLAFILFHLDPGEYRVSVSPLMSAPGLVVTGRFP